MNGFALSESGKWPIRPMNSENGAVIRVVRIRSGVRGYISTSYDTPNGRLHSTDCIKLGRVNCFERTLIGEPKRARTFKVKRGFGVPLR
jgi:hypothetical protein